MLKKLIFLSLLFSFLTFFSLQHQSNSSPDLSQPLILPEPTSASEIKLVFVGDVSLGRMVNIRIQERGSDYPFQKVTSFLRQANLAFANLESPLASLCPTTGVGTKFCAPPENVASLVAAGLDLVSVANNHIFDYGQTGFEKTISTLTQAGIEPIGFKHQPIISLEGTKFAFLAYDATTAGVNKENLKTTLLRAEDRADVVVVSFHWGTEYTEQPILYQKQLARLAVDYGADLVVGHHPHWIQEEEYYSGKYIFYSLGNFVFDQMWSKPTRTGLMLTVFFEGAKLTKIEKQEVYIKDYCQPHPILVE